NLPMPQDSPYRCSWWYRAEFAKPTRERLPAAAAGTGDASVPLDDYFWLHFAGVNFRANVWVNGKQIADAEHMKGMWREWEYNITRELVAGTNALAVEVFAQKEDDLAITFVDWNPMPPDKDMGLYRPVYLTRSGPVAL